jgi:multicomponent K+:H+ antiporter subunit G
MSVAGEIVVSALVVLGGVFCLLGSIGLARLPDVFMRLHGPGKATTLGVGCVALASVVHFSVRLNSPSLGGLLIILFVAITTPVSAHLVAKAALHRRLPQWRRDRDES